ncbi:MAG: Acetyltransferase [uncultured bacterium]|nr:MAG: Acetyltransferase [uncultured bacterium]
MEIYKLDASQWREYKELRLEALREDAEAFGMSYAEALSLLDEEWQDEFENRKGFILVASEDSKLLAMIGAYQEEGEKMKHIAYVWGVYVRKEHRGKGIGKMLMESLLEELAKNKELEKVDLNVNTSQLSAVRLYEKLGFKIAGTLHSELKIGTKYYDEHVMEKFL